MKDLLAFLATGRLLTWLLQTNGLTAPLWELHPKLRELGECDLCLGFWVYLGLALRERRPDPLVTAAVASFAMHLMRLGWHARFGTTIIE